MDSLLLIQQATQVQPRTQLHSIVVARTRQVILHQIELILHLMDRIQFPIAVVGTHIQAVNHKKALPFEHIRELMYQVRPKSLPTIVQAHPQMLTPIQQPL